MTVKSRIQNIVHHQTVETVKTHLQENKKVYIASGVSLVVGAVGALAFSGGGTQIVDSFKLINWKSPHTSQTVLVRRGHPGFIIRCNQTGELFASQRRAAIANGINQGTLSSHLHGKYPDIGGLTFTCLGEAS